MIEFSLLCLDRHKNLKNIDEILSHVDSVHLDIMDNIFVKNTAFDTAFINNMSTKLKPKRRLKILKKTLRGKNTFPNCKNNWKC